MKTDNFKPERIWTNLAVLVGASIAMSTTALTFAVLPMQHSAIAGSNKSTPAKSPLAKELQGKPVVVDIYATWCGACKNIAPTLSNVKQQYKDKVNFVVFDVSDRKTTEASAAKAQKLGLTSFFEANKSRTSTVGVIDPRNGQIVKQFFNNANAKDYTAAIETTTAQMKKK
jgi:thiol-disulfide isomerase/thioredoxin